MADSNCFYNLLRNKAVQLLAQRNHTSQEIKNKLVLFCKKKYANKPDDLVEILIQIEPVIESCIAQKWLDEQAYIEQYAVMRARKAYGKKRIILELQQRGIEGNITDIINGQNIDWISIGIKLVCKKYQVVDTNNPQQKMKIFQFLSYKGFSQEDIRFIYSDF